MSSTTIVTQKRARKNIASASRGRQKRLGTIQAEVTQMPKYSKNQLVQFIGGMGTILSCHPESGTWTYAVEMAMGKEPLMGEIGNETTILLHEIDIHGVINFSGHSFN